MSPQEVARTAALVTGGLQFLANAASLARGPLRIRAELQAGNLSERFADLLGVAWTYGCVANLFIAVLLFLLAGPLRDGSVLAWRIAAGVGAYYVLVGAATYALGVRRHPGLLAFILFGLLLLIPLWSARAHYGR
jgi:hypothetical protein